MRVTAAHTRAPRVYVLEQREFRRLRLPRATTPATLAATVSEYAGDAACNELAETLPATTGALCVRVFFCAGERSVVAFVHEGHEGGQPACIVGLERACELAGAPAAAVFVGLWQLFEVGSLAVHAHA
jgi:copper oxidase (laccase) domain-containing protein